MLTYATPTHVWTVLPGLTLGGCIPPLPPSGFGSNPPEPDSSATPVSPDGGRLLGGVGSGFHPVPDLESSCIESDVQISKIAELTRNAGASARCLRAAFR